MGGIKYYHLAKDEEPPDEFCAIRDVGGEPSEYVFYIPDAENAKLRELVRILAYCMSEDSDCDKCVLNDADMPTPRISACDELPDRMRELGIEVD